MHKSEMPNPSPKYCRLNCENEWIAIYKSLVGITAGEGTIYDLFNPKANLILELEDRGIERLVDIPEELLDPKRAWQLKALKEGTHIDQKKINKFLNSLEYPLYFLDYETLASVTPPFDGYKPYQQIPFQYSLHVIERPGAQTKHVEYLHSENSDPVPPLSCSLQENIGSKGSILVWYEDFEKTCNLAMGKIAPEFKDFYSDVNTRIVDLMTPFSKFHYVDAAFGGSASIKKVLPVLVPELSHSVLDISEGATAQRLWMEAILEGKHADKKEKILKDLWDYCELDTLAMVKIWEFLANNFSEETNKPKENIQQALF